MIVGREQLIVLEEFAKKQERIYPDACDYGYRWIEGRIGMQEVHRLRQAVVELMGIFKYKSLCWGTDRSGGRSIELFVPYEQDGDGYAGVLVKVGMHWDRSRRVKYSTIEIGQHRQSDVGLQK